MHIGHYSCPLACLCFNQPVQ